MRDEQIDERIYGLHTDHLRLMADRSSLGYHVLGMSTDARWIEIGVGGEMCVAGQW